MRKLIAILTIIITTFSIASPYIMGFVAQYQFTSELEAALQENDSQVSISEIKFDRGYAQSDASFVITFVDLIDDLSPVSILFESKMQHTPINMNEFGLSIFEVYSQERLSLTQGPEGLMTFVNVNMDGYFLSGYSRTNFSKRFDRVLTMPSIDFNGDDVNIKIDPVMMNTSGLLDVSELSYGIKLPSMAISVSEYTVVTANISITGDSNMDISGLELANSLMEVAQISIKSTMGVAEIKNMSLSAESDLVDNKVDTNIHYKIESIESPWPVTTANYHMYLNDLPLTSAMLLQGLQNDIDVNAATPESPETYFDALLIATLKPDLQLKQILTGDVFGGEWLIDLDVKYTGIEGVDVFALADPKVAIQSVAATMLVKADNKSFLASPLAPMLDGLLKQGLIKIVDADVTSTAHLTAGKLTVNELEIPVEPLIDAVLLKIAQRD